ncbi:MULTISPECIES: hydrolase [Haloarcula]|uniref:hydrolase n=1 Tax=Haloarcula TaxID=2237 RepID=UPI0023ED6DFB|nr:hydrolase [Halomicroarcula sp. XH51]
MSLSWRAAAVTPDGTPPTPDAWDPVTIPGRPPQFAGADAVAYETKFADPRGPGEEHARLVLHGTFAHARVWCNGERVATHDAYFAPLRVRLPDADEYRVVVECRAPEDRFGGLHATDALPAERRVPGIWWRAAVEARPDPYVDDVRVAPRLTDDGAAVDVTADVLTTDAIDDRLTVTLRPEGASRGGGTMSRSQVTAGSGTATVSHTIEVRDPALWWPHDRGEQARYVVRAKVGDDAHAVTTGLRTVETGDAGFRVNGERVPARGVTLLDPTADDVERAAAANANLVRVRAQGAPPAVAAACDRHGVLLWQDLPLTGAGGFDAERGADLAASLVDTYDHRPSLAAVGVHDAPVGAYASGLGSGPLDRLRFRFRAWRAAYDATAAERVADAVETVPTVPVVGPPGIDSDALTLFPGWEYGRATDLEWLCDRYGGTGMVGGFGAGSLGTDDPADEAGFDRRAHERYVDDGREASQAYQARLVRTVAEGFRERGTGVVVLETLRDVADAGMGVLAADGAAKPAFDALADAYEPTRVVLADPTPGPSDVVLLHDGGATETVTVEWDHEGAREQAEHTVGPHGRVTAGSLDLSAGDEVTLAVAVGDRVVKSTYQIASNI